MPPVSTVRRGHGLLAGLLLALSLVTMSGAPAEATVHRVTIRLYAYGPRSLSIAYGDTVTWTNLDTAAHDVTVTSGPEKFRSPMLSKGQSWSHTFTTAGSYSYICSVHPDMHGSVVVMAAPPAPKPAVVPPPASHVPATTSTSVATPRRHTARRQTAAQPRAAASPSAATTPAGSYLATVPQPENASLNPLLLVLGFSSAVVVFCLLLLASRSPERSPDGGATAESRSM